MSEKTVELHHDQGLRFVAQTGSGHEIVMDDSKSDTGARPTEVLLVAYGGCASMDVLSVVRKKRQTVNRFDSRIRAVARDEYPQIFTDIEITVELEGPDVTVAAVRDAIALAARKYCSVGATLAAGDTTIHHRYRVINTGPEPFDESGEAMVTGPFARVEALGAND